MSNKISRRSFLKVSGASALALGAASMLGGCQSSSSNSVEVKVGDKISNWNNLAVQLTSVFTLADAPDVPGSKYVAILVTAVNRSKTDSMAIGAQNIAEIDAAYPLTDEASRAANTAPYFHALSASTTDFTVTVDAQVVPVADLIADLHLDRAAGRLATAQHGCGTQCKRRNAGDLQKGAAGNLVRHKTASLIGIVFFFYGSFITSFAGKCKPFAEKLTRVSHRGLLLRAKALDAGLAGLDQI